MSPRIRKGKAEPVPEQKPVEAASSEQRPANEAAEKRLFPNTEGEGPKKGFYLFPNLVTSGSLFCGFWSICKTFSGDYIFASWLIFIAMIFDGLDGKVARLTRTTSQFGVHYDSLADLVSFGVAPGILLYSWALVHAFHPGGGWVVAAMYVICGVIRLARFNVHFDPNDKRYFKGLPIPAAACFAALTVLFFKHMEWVEDGDLASMPNLVLLIAGVLAFLMISTIRYFSFKDVDFFRKRPLPILLVRNFNLRTDFLCG